MQFKATIFDLLLNDVPIRITICYSHGHIHILHCVVFIMFLKGN